MSCAERLAAVLLLLILAPAFAEETEWVIAAEQFEAIDLPAAYSNFAVAVPKLLMSRLSAVTSRDVLPEENQRRELAALAESRISLVRERSDAVLARDRLALASGSTLSRDQKRKELDRKIRDTEKKLSGLDDRTTRTLSSAPGVKKPVTARLKPWKTGGELYVRGANMSLRKSMARDGLSGLVSGSVRDLAGYLLVTARLDTGAGSDSALTVSEAAPYDEIGDLIERLAARLIPEIANQNKVVINLNVTPPDARVFIDNRLVTDLALPVTVFAGTHSISVTAPGFVTASRTADFGDRTDWKVSITLVPEAVAPVTLDADSHPAQAFFGAGIQGELPLTATLPGRAQIGEAVTAAGTTWFVLDPSSRKDGGDGGTETLELTIDTNRKNSKTRIAKQRSVLYWSLGALYLSLPASMLSGGIYTSKYAAWQDGTLADTEAARQDILTWSRVSNVTTGISIGLGVNLAFQIARYFIAADQVVPKSAEPGKD